MGTTKYVWDPVFDCVTHELDENNNVKAEYHHEPQQYGGVLSQRRGTTTHYHHHDALGSTRFLTDSSGNVTDTYLHDAWGNLVASTGTTINPFKWVGKYGYYTDNSTAQVYVRARMYQPTVARWCIVDPLGTLTHLYGLLYTSNRPATYQDPSGLVTENLGCHSLSGEEIDLLSKCNRGNPCTCKVTSNSPWSDPNRPFFSVACRDGEIAFAANSCTFMTPMEGREFCELRQAFKDAGILHCLTHHEMHHIAQYQCFCEGGLPWSARWTLCCNIH